MFAKFLDVSIITQEITTVVGRSWQSLIALATLKANFVTGALRRSASLPDVFTQSTCEYFAHKKQD
ncbi:hypothetical protein pdam_00019963, partial [Pocillopora damicornis]